MRLLQILLAQSEGGAETFFEKTAIAFQTDPAIEQQLIVEAHAKRESRLRSSDCSVTSLPVDWLSKKTIYNPKLQMCARMFKPDITLAWMSRAARKAPTIKGAIKVARIGGYYPLKHYLSCDYLVANTPELVTYMVNQGWNPQKIAMISNFGEIPTDTPHGVDPRTLIPVGKPTLLTLGRLHKNKAQDILIKALPQIKEAHLLIAGEGEVESYLRELAQKLDVADRVHFLGWRRDTKFLFDCTDICVFPSREEPLGNVVLEAWATHTPIVAAESSGPAWLIDHLENGLLCPIDAPQQLAVEVNRLLDDPTLSKKLVQQGYRKFESKFSKEIILAQYHAFFKEILEAKHRQRTADLSPWQ